MALIKCPECQRRISSKAPSCPHCGFPLQSASPQPATFSDDFKTVKKVGWWVAFAISIGSLTVPTIIGKIISPGSLGGTETQTFWTIFVLTAPLTGAVGIYSALLFNKAFRDMTDNGWVHMFIIVAILVLTTLIANLVHAPNALPLRDVLGESGGLQTLLFNMLKNYFKAYGAWKFLCSLALGIFLGWTWEKLFAHARRFAFRKRTT